MGTESDSLAAYVDRLGKLAPEYLDLLTATTDAEFEAAFDAILSKAVCGMERNSKNFADLAEEGLSAVLILALTIPGLAVSQEANSNGHVDLTIEADHCVPPRVKLGEAKIYRGFEYHIGGLQQLLERYSTGRESRGLLITYVQKRDIAKRISELRTRMDAERPQCQTCATADHSMKWWFLSRHQHSSGEELQVQHVGCNLYCARTADS